MDAMVDRYGSDPKAKDRSEGFTSFQGFITKKIQQPLTWLRSSRRTGAPPIPIATVARKLGSVEKRPDAHLEAHPVVEVKNATNKHLQIWPESA